MNLKIAPIRITRFETATAYFVWNEKKIIIIITSIAPPPIPDTLQSPITSPTTMKPATSTGCAGNTFLC